MNKIDKTDTLTKILSHRRFTVDVFQREYRWGRKQIEQMISDFQDTFEEFYDPDNHDTPLEVMNYGYYYMGCIICTGGSPNKIIDGQQRLLPLAIHSHVHFPTGSVISVLVGESQSLPSITVAMSSSGSRAVLPSGYFHSSRSRWQVPDWSNGSAESCPCPPPSVHGRRMCHKSGVWRPSPNSLFAFI